MNCPRCDYVIGMGIALTLLISVLLVFGCAINGPLAGREEGLKSNLDSWLAQAGLAQYMMIESVEADAASLSINVTFTPPSSIGEARGATYMICQQAVSQLMSMGINPHEQCLLIFVHAEEPAGQGATGEPLVRLLGSCHYDYNSDNINFDPPPPPGS